MSEQHKPETFGCKAKAWLEQSLKVLKESVHGAEVVAGATADVTKLHLQSRKNAQELARTFQDLGAELYAVMQHSAATTIEITPQLRLLAEKIAALEEEVTNAEEKLAHSTVVEKKKHS